MIIGGYDFWPGKWAAVAGGFMGRAAAALLVCASFPVGAAAAEDETGDECPVRDRDILESYSHTGDIGSTHGPFDSTVFFPKGSGQGFFLEAGVRWGKKGFFSTNVTSPPHHFFAKTYSASANAQAYNKDEYWNREGMSADEHGSSYGNDTKYFDLGTLDMSVPGARRGIIITIREDRRGRRNDEGIIIASSDDGKHLAIDERTYERERVYDGEGDKTRRTEVHSLWAGIKHVVSDITKPTGPPLIVSDGDVDRRDVDDNGNFFPNHFYEGRVAKLLSIDDDGGDRLHAVLNLHILFDLKEPYWPNAFKFFMHGAGKDKTLLILHRTLSPDENGDWPLTLLAVRPEHEEALVWRDIVGRLEFEADVLASFDVMPPLMIHDGALVLWEKPFYAWGEAGQAQLVHFPRITITPMPDGSVDLAYSDPADACPLPEDPWAWLNTPNDQE